MQDVQTDGGLLEVCSKELVQYRLRRTSERMRLEAEIEKDMMMSK